jgi:osmoprotectant transport system permease protein
VIGSKIFTEQYILLNMYRMLIRGYSNLDVATRTGLGGTQICFEALRKGEIDMYPEYTGTGLLVILKAGQPTVDSLIVSKEKVYKFVRRGFKKEFNLVWLQPLGFNNAYALVMRRQQAARLGIASVSDLEQFLKN